MPLKSAGKRLKASENATLCNYAMEFGKVPSSLPPEKPLRNMESQQQLQMEPMMESLVKIKSIFLV